MEEEANNENAEMVAAPEAEEVEERTVDEVPPPFTELKDRDGETWVKLYCGTKVVLIKPKQVSAMTWEKGDGGEPFIHLANAKDVLRVNPESWCEFNTYLFGDLKD